MFDANAVEWQTQEMIRRHGAYINNYPDGERADMRGGKFTGALLNGVDLRRALASNGDFRGTQFMGADLSEVNFSGSQLKAADFSGGNS